MANNIMKSEASSRMPYSTCSRYNPVQSETGANCKGATFFFFFRSIDEPTFNNNTHDLFFDTI